MLHFFRMLLGRREVPQVVVVQQSRGERDSPPEPCLWSAEGPKPSLVREANQLIFGVRPLPRSKDKRLVFEGVSSIGTPSPTLSMASHGAPRDAALVRGRAGAPPLIPARAARSSRERFRFSLLRILAAQRSDGPIYRADEKRATPEPVKRTRNARRG